MSFPRYPEYRDSGVEWLGKVPEHWANWKVAHAFNSIGSGTTPPSNEQEWYDGGTVPWVTTGELRENVIEDTKKSVTVAALNTFQSLQVHPPGSLAIAMYGATIGRLGILGIKAATNQACCVLSDPRHLDPKFMFYWFMVFKESIIALYASGGGQPNINQETIASLRVPAPSIHHQLEIARFLDHETAKIDALIQEQQRLIKLLKEKRQAVISHAVTKGLDPSVPMKDSGVEWLGEVPEHWDVVSLRYLFCIKKSIAGELGYEVLSITNKGIKVKDIESGDGQLSNDYGKYQLVEVGDYAMNHMDLLTGYVDRSKYLGVTSPDYRVFELARPTIDNPSYMLRLLQNAYHRKLFFPFGQGAAHLGRWRLPTEEFKDFCFPVPPYSEQIDIAAFVEDELHKVDNAISVSELSIPLLSERRSALISAAVTGKIDVRNWQPPADESAFDEEVHQAGLEVAS